MIKRVIITGCAGFIGFYISKSCLNLGWKVMGIDKMTYCGNTKSLTELKTYNNFSFIQKDINDVDHIYDCDYVINLAAETHVDNSIENDSKFVHSNINGVVNLLTLIRKKPSHMRPVFLQFSTDEVYGDLVKGSFDETAILKPSNPYSATKASIDLIIQSYHRTYGIPYLLVRPSNNYGVGQYIEKFIPKTCQYLALEKKVPLHEKGTPIRTWLHAQDTADAVIHLLKNDIVNDVYNISGNYEDTNINVFKKILSKFGIDPDNYLEYVDFSVNRPGQDVRYHINDDKLRKLGWNNQMNFDLVLNDVVHHHRMNFKW